MADLEQPPVYTELVNQSRLVTGKWLDWFSLRLLATVNALVKLLTKPPVSLTAQHAAISTTAIPLPVLSGGTYRLAYYLRITTADAVSSRVTVTLGWTDGTIVCAASGAAVTGNTTSTFQSGTVTVNADASTALTYSTAYTSNTPGQMQYKLTIAVEQIN